MDSHRTGVVGSQGREHARNAADASPSPLWDVGGGAAPPPAASRPATPATTSISPDAGRHGTGRLAAHPPRPTTAAASAGTPPTARPLGMHKGMRTSSGSLTGLLKRPGTAGAARPPAAASPMAAPMFELRGAAMLPPEPPARPATSSVARGTQQQQQQPHHKPPASPTAFSLHARAGYRPTTAGPSSSPTAAGVVSHGLDLSVSPHLAPASGPVRQQQRRPATPTTAQAALGVPPAASATTAPPQQQLQQAHSATGALSVHSSLAPHGSSSLPASSVLEYGTAGSSSVRPYAAATTVHQNPLYTGGSESFAGSRQQVQQPARAPPPVRVTPLGGGATATPPTPPTAAFLAPSAGATPSASPHAALQAASNLTLVSDSRPISPGPFLSTLASATDSHRGSRPVSPQCMGSPHSTPPTPGSFAPAGVAAAAAAVSRTMLSPIKSASSSAVTGAPQSRSLPASPAPASAAAAAGSPAAGGSCGVAAFRVPIFNQDGRLVGYKQNSNLIPRPGTCISSAPSSPSCSTLLPDAAAGFQTTSYSAAGEGMSPPPPRLKAAPAVPPPSDSGDFAEFASDPCKGFSDIDNVVPGYVLGPVLGKGGFCSVRKALHELTGQAVACKIIEKGKLKDPKDRDRVDRECRVMRNLSNHVAVVKLYEYVETRDYVYIMMEAARRGSLLDYVREKKRLPEDEAITIFQQLLHSLQFCHRKDVVHRDIKLENILIDSAGHMKLIDFGLCGYFVTGKRLRCHCGSPSYAAPEIVARKDYLGPPVDVWSLGIVLFAMLAGYLPFHAKEKKQLSDKILAGLYKPAAWMSAEVQDLLARMLTLDPEQRITLEAVWAHPWVARSPRWEAPGVGAGRLYRSLTDPTTGAVLPDEAVMAQLEVLGADTTAIRRALRSRECNSLTATYHLVLEAHLEAQRAAAAREREAAAERAKRAAASSAADWQWDFAAISAAGATAPVAPAGAGGSGCIASGPASAGSSSLRSSGSPARPRTAAGSMPAGSPTRFGQEAAAAGYLSPGGRHAAPAASGYTPNPFSPPSFQPQREQQQQQQQQQQQDGSQLAPPAAPSTTRQLASSEPFTIKALHAGTEQGAGSGAAAAVSAALITSSTVATTTTIVATTEGPTSPCKSPRLAPLPTVLSPKQLAPVGRASSGSEHSPPIAQAV